MFVKPAPQHAWLQHLLGTWITESECSPGPGEELFRGTGRETVQMLGELWTIAEGVSTMPGGGSMTSRMQLGFDKSAEIYVGAWVGSVASTQFIYHGTLDDTERIMTLDTTGPCFSDPSRIASYQDVITLTGDDTRELLSRYEDAEGTWHEFMTVRYRRTS